MSKAIFLLEHDQGLRHTAYFNHAVIAPGDNCRKTRSYDRDIFEVESDGAREYPGVEKTAQLKCLRGTDSCLPESQNKMGLGYKSHYRFVSAAV